MLRVASTSQEDDRVQVTAKLLGAAYDPTGDSVWFAYLTGDSTPGADDDGWTVGRWETNTDPTGPASPYFAVVTLGGVDVTLAASTEPYRRWLKILDSGNAIIRPVGTLTVY